MCGVTSVPRTRTLAALTGVSSAIDQSRKAQAALVRPTLMLDRSVQTALRPAALKWENPFSNALGPIIEQQNKMLAQIARPSLPSSYFHAVNAFERSAIGRARELSPFAMAPQLRMLDAVRVDWAMRPKAFDQLVRTVQAAGVAASVDVVVPDDERIEPPEWLLEFAARVQLLPPRERRALVSNLLGIALAIASTILVWTTTGGVAGYVSSGLLMKTVFDLSNTIIALYEDGDPAPSEERGAE